jgi:hypothetical protein
MRWGKFWFRSTCIAAALASVCACASAQQAVDLEGHRVNPFIAASGKPVVLVFLRRDCPVSGRYAPTIQQISKQYGERATFWLVYADKSEKPQDIRKSVDDFGYKLPVLRDLDHQLVKLAHAQITPEVAVFDREQKLVYDGRIDDSYIDLARSRPSPTTHELEDAIIAAAKGTTVARPEVRGVGCYIADVE